MNSSPTTTGREIRVFISSTLRDMTRERDLLVKEIFPELRRKSANWFVTFTEVDLRWGITEEQAAEGQVLPLCLAEIERSRPYFIGLLGERYGWIRETIDPQVVEREPWLREHIEGRTSVTELANAGNHYVLAQLGLFLSDNGPYPSAEPLLRRALEARERVLGPEHPDTLTTMQNLADLFDKLGHTEDGRALRVRRLRTLDLAAGGIGDGGGVRC